LKRYSIAIIDDEKDITSAYEIYLRRSGVKDYIISNDPLEYLNNLKDIKADVVFLDLRMPGLTGEELLDEIMSIYPDTSAFIISGNDEVETAVRCIKKGALDYIVKPIDKARFQTALLKGQEMFNIKSELSEMRSHLLENKEYKSDNFKDIITRNKNMQDVFRYIELVSKSNSPVIITGETGTGKELMAEAVHRCSDLKGDMIPVNVSALDGNMFNDTLFGHTKGAFTGADKPRKGLLASANGGSVFLDEIGDLDESAQIKLLRLIQNGEYLPLGSDKPEKTTARIIAATNVDLKQKVAEGKFRQDLYYRLQTHMVRIPPLRDRSEDIELIANYYFIKEGDKLGNQFKELPANLTESLIAHDFPGNIRELQAIVMDYAISFGDKKVNISTLKEFLSKHGLKYSKRCDKIEDNGFSYSGNFPTLKEIEAILIEKALESTDGNQSKAAKLLGISRQALNKRLN
jgi:DNA-binding NtrC family response regulator